MANSEKLPTSSFSNLCLNDDRLAGIEGRWDAGASSSMEIWGGGWSPQPRSRLGMFELEKIHLGQPTETRRNAACGCLPLTDTLLSLMWL